MAELTLEEELMLDDHQLDLPTADESQQPTTQEQPSTSSAETPSEQRAPVARTPRSLKLLVPMPLSAAVDEAVQILEASPPAETEFDIVLSGGGLAIYYSSAVVAILGQPLLKDGACHASRASRAAR